MPLLDNQAAAAHRCMHVQAKVAVFACDQVVPCCTTHTTHATQANANYKWILAAEAGSELAYGFASESSLAVAALWHTVGQERGLLAETENRFLSWFWTDMTEHTADATAARAAALGVDTIVLLDTWAPLGDELAISNASFPSGIKKTVDHILDKYGLKLGLHMHPDIVWPCVGGVGIECLETGAGVSPVVTDNAAGLVPEGLAPTYRSGDPGGMNGGWATEDLGFWWGHDPLFIWGRPSPNGTRVVAHNGNPFPCGQGFCNPLLDWGSNDWCPGMQLYNTVWATTGIYRGGYVHPLPTLQHG